MGYRLVVAPSAMAEMRRAAAWWDHHRPEARYTIESEVDAALTGIDEHPRRGLRIAAGGRPLYQLQLQRIGYRLLYDVDDERQVIEIVAFVHGARRPR